MLRNLLFLVALAGALLTGFWLAKPSPPSPLPIATQTRPFVLIVHASSDAAWCEECLTSLFAQEYDAYRLIFFDDASSDDTLKIAKAFAEANQQSSRCLFFRHEQSLGKVASFYRGALLAEANEIALFLEAKDRLAHPHVLSLLNRYYEQPYQGQEVWGTSGGALSYPTFEKREGELLSCYPSLWTQIPLSHLFSGGNSLDPLRTLIGKHLAFPEEPLLLVNEARPKRQEPSPPTPRLSPLSSLPPLSPPQKVDLLLFSFDRPLQLYACLESIQRYLTGYDHLFVLYRASSAPFAAAYDELKHDFPTVEFVAQSSDQPKKDFKRPLLRCLSSSSPYIVFGVDDLIVKDFVDLSSCARLLEQTKSYGFYLRFGSHISTCYQTGQLQTRPLSFPLTEGVFAWDVTRGEGDWGFPNNLDLTLYRKKDLQKAFQTMKYNTPNGLEFNWAKEHRPERAIGLYFDHSKVVNLPLNVMSQTGNPHMNLYSPEQLLEKFEAGLKIDIDPLYRVENESPHFPYSPQFILR